MAPTPENIFFIVHYNGKVSRNQFGSFFESEQRKCFNVSIKSTIDHLKKRIEQKLHLSESQVISKIIYRAPQTIVASNIQYNDTEIFDNDDIADMFATHKYFNPVGSIELSVMIENREIPQHRQAPQLPYTQLSSQTQYEFEPPSSSQQLPYTQLFSQTQYEFEPSSSQPPPQSQPQTQNRLEDLFTRRFEDIPDNIQEQEEEGSSESDEDEALQDEELQHEASSESDEDEHQNRNEEEYIWRNIMSGTQPQPPQHAVPIRAAYCPPLHMRNVDVDAYDALPNGDDWDTNIPVNGAIKAGMTFHSKEDCLHAIKLFHIGQSRDYDVIHSDPNRYVIQCTLETCQFKLRASFRKRSGKWKIGTMMGPHSCTSTLLSQDHRKLNYKLISQSIKTLVHADASVTPKLIIAHIQEKFNYTTTYRKAWLAKNAAIESIYGKWEESYNDLPQWLNVMKETTPGTVFDLKTRIGENGETQFHRLFWAFYPCIHGFQYCKPVVHVDGTWLYGKYKGTLLLAVAQDGNNKTIPIAFALVEGETKEGWSFFLKNLRRHVTKGISICMVSDRHESIKSAFNDPRNGWQETGSAHVYCIRHIKQNFMRTIKDGDLKDVVNNMGKHIILRFFYIVLLLNRFTILLIVFS